MITDLSVGTPGKVLRAYTLPLFGSVVFQQLYNIADSVIAGRACGEDALAAIGASYPITAIFTAFAFGLNAGAGVVISRLFGAGRKREMKTAVTTAYIMSAVLCLLLTALGVAFASPMLRMLNTPENIFPAAAAYLRIYTAGITFVFFYNVTTGIFAALGDSRTPFYFLVASSVGNVILDIIFVVIFARERGVEGVAWATFIAQGAACICALAAFAHRMRSFATEKAPLFSWDLFAKISSMAVPSILQNSFVSVGNLMLQSLINGYGSAVVAGYSAAIKFNTFTITCFSAMSNGISAYTSQNIGAGKTERVREGLRASILMATIVAIPFFIVYTFFGGTAMKLFLESGADGAALEAGKSFLRIASPFYFCILIKIIVDGVLRGGGDVTGFTCATFADLILRVAFGYLFAYLWHSPVGTSVWWSWPAGWVVGVAVSLGFYFSGRWKRRII